MLALRNPSEAYRRVDFDARVEGADPRTLVMLCYESLVSSLGTALFAHDRGDNRAKSAALTRAVSALTALLLGIEGQEGISAHLRAFYEAARRRVLDNVIAFAPEQIAQVREDIREIAAALSASS
ncbi:MAG TPA: flagellar protein FliS [Novosphingobium sp.]|nr:flagellar protein FliS [Novosphingobium sp.]